MAENNQQYVNPDTELNQQNKDIPTHPMLLYYALAVNFFHYGGMTAYSDILSESPTANGLFPSTISNYDIAMQEYEQDDQVAKAAESDMNTLINSPDPDIAEVFSKASQESDPEDSN